MLAGHSQIACGPETQFFNKLSNARLKAALKDPAWPRQAVKLVTSLTLAEQPVAELFGHSSRDVQTFLGAREPSVQAHARVANCPLRRKTRQTALGRKNSRTTFCTCLKSAPFYPGAPVVRIVRDPRDSALSVRQLPWASRSALANAYLVGHLVS